MSDGRCERCGRDGHREWSEALAEWVCRDCFKKVRVYFGSTYVGGSP